MHLRGAAAGGEETEVVEVVADVVGDGAELRFLEADDAVVGAGKIGEEAAEADGVGAGDDAELAGAAPGGIAGTVEVIADGFAMEKMAVLMKAGDAAGNPAIEEGRAEGDEAAGAGIGVFFEGVAEEDAAHAVADGVEGFAGGGLDEGAEAADVFGEAAEHGVVMKLADVVAEATEAMAEEGHFPAVDDGTVDEEDGWGLGHKGRLAGGAGGTRLWARAC